METYNIFLELIQNSFLFRYLVDNNYYKEEENGTI